jgi:hypothetical protein
MNIKNLMVSGLTLVSLLGSGCATNDKVQGHVIGNNYQRSEESRSEMTYQYVSRACGPTPQIAALYARTNLAKKVCGVERTMTQSGNTVLRTERVECTLRGSRIIGREYENGQSCVTVGIPYQK